MKKLIILSILFLASCTALTEPIQDIPAGAIIKPDKAGVWMDNESATKLYNLIIQQDIEIKALKEKIKKLEGANKT